MKLPFGTKLYMSPTGKRLALTVDRPRNHGDVLYSPGGATFVELTVTGTGYGKQVEQLNLSDPFDNDRSLGLLVRVSDIVVFDAEPYTRIDQDPDVTIKRVGPVRVIDTIVRLDSGDLAVVTAPKYNFRYADMRLYIGFPGQLVEWPLTSVERLRDGGTTTYATADGVLHVPARAGLARNAQRPPSWETAGKCEYGVRIDQSTFVIRHEADGVLEITATI